MTRAASEREMYMGLIGLGLAETRFKGKPMTLTRMRALADLAHAYTLNRSAIEAREFLGRIADEADKDERAALSNRTLDRLREFKSELFTEVTLIEAGLRKLESSPSNDDMLMAWEEERVEWTDEDVLAFGRRYLRWAEETTLVIAYAIDNYSETARELRAARRANDRAAQRLKPEPEPPTPASAPLCSACGKRARHWGDLCKRCTPADQRPTGKVA